MTRKKKTCFDFFFRRYLKDHDFVSLRRKRSVKKTSYAKEMPDLTFLTEKTIITLLINRDHASERISRDGAVWKLVGLITRRS